MLHVTRIWSLYLCLAALLNGIIANSTLAGQLLHVHDECGVLATLDVSTGKVSKIGSMGVVMTDIAFDPDGNLFGISYNDFYRIDRRTAATTWIGRHNIPGGNALTFAPDGTPFAAGGGSTKLYAIDPLSGKATAHREMGFASAGDLAYDPDAVCADGMCICPPDDRLLMTSTDGDLVTVPRNPFYGPASSMGKLGVDEMFGLVRTDNGKLYGLSGNTLYSVNRTNGSAKFLLSFGGQGLGQVYGACSDVPEPASLALIAVAGVAVIGVIARTRRRRDDHSPGGLNGV